MTQAALGVTEDAEQARTLATVTLPYDPNTGEVLRGPLQGFHIEWAAYLALDGLLRTYTHVRATTVTLHPWWRWWQATPARVLRPGNGPEDTL